MTFHAGLILVSLVACISLSLPAAPFPGEERFRDIYKELVETNTTLSEGSCTLAASRMAARLKAAGFSDEEIELFSPDFS